MKAREETPLLSKDINSSVQDGQASFSLFGNDLLGRITDELSLSDIAHLRAVSRQTRDAVDNARISLGPVVGRQAYRVVNAAFNQHLDAPALEPLLELDERQQDCRLLTAEVGGWIALGGVGLGVLDGLCWAGVMGCQSAMVCCTADTLSVAGCCCVCCMGLASDRPAAEVESDMVREQPCVDCSGPAACCWSVKFATGLGYAAAGVAGIGALLACACGATMAVECCCRRIRNGRIEARNQEGRDVRLAAQNQLLGAAVGRGEMSLSLFRRQVDAARGFNREVGASPVPRVRMTRD